MFDKSAEISTLATRHQALPQKEKMQIIDRGQDNLVIGEHEHITGTVEFTGNEARVEIGLGCTANHVVLQVGQKGEVSIGAHCSLGRFEAYLHKPSRLTIGAETGMGWVRVLMHESATCSIGKQCLFSTGIDISVSDMHSIFDRATGDRINPAKPISIGENCWIGEGVMILKGATIGGGSIIGARSVVTGNVPAHCAAAGNPARVVRENVFWKYDL